MLHPPLFCCISRRHTWCHIIHPPPPSTVSTRHHYAQRSCSVHRMPHPHLATLPDARSTAPPRILHLFPAATPKSRMLVPGGRVLAIADDGRERMIHRFRWLARLCPSPSPSPSPSPRYPPPAIRVPRAAYRRTPSGNELPVENALRMPELQPLTSSSVHSPWPGP
ncbi:hypothetical protein CC85DRAFT_129188 [Cutaneotrichosporon oleaginosum]|uniref:Uncharacterized protein n=1 Tax=Cutaneotrichosporon oleaginosum TaxID=879819 RepID=A0A0J0XJ77_9TREE|nr:uncharacterized protein CC85DRAFT_129188 [Cutaneotrichosporon oleaginosum]KLT41118.1 hypothetical protein CC85DRAFT_129188 [Cutaneotrichosporon oleaginosum]TXT05750.1 hypothetical protein COLE_07070 [Cutaneotrichosporon oleaginosum]